MNENKSQKGFSLLEVMVTLVIVGLLAAAAILPLRGLISRDNVDRGAQQVVEDLIFIRGRAISTNLRHRLNFSTDSTWQVETQDPSSLVWSPIGSVHRMPTGTTLTAATFTNAGRNIEATSRGIFEFKPILVSPFTIASGSPFVTVQCVGEPKTKSVYVDVGGAISARMD